jgi:hypothetical protein
VIARATDDKKRRNNSAHDYADPYGYKRALLLAPNNLCGMEGIAWKGFILQSDSEGTC